MSKNVIKKSVMKKIMIFCLTGGMIFGLSACNLKSNTGNNSSAVNESKQENIGNFETTDLKNAKVTQEIFKENDLTMINLLSSTCNPCIEELPHLSELSDEYKDKKVGILGVNIDMDSSGNPDENSRKMVSQVLKENTNMKVIFLDENLINNLLKRTDALPYTIFVDNKGNIVSKEYLGSHSKEEWAKIIDDELMNISQK